MPVVERKSPDHLTEVCRVCGTVIPLPSDLCEFDGAPPERPRAYRTGIDGMPGRAVIYGGGEPRLSYHRRPILRERIPVAEVVPGSTASQRPCQCNGCQGKRRKRGNQPAYCSDACKRAAKKADNAARAEAAREQQRARAAEWIAAYPDASDKEIARMAGIAVVKRVAETRE